MKKMFEDWYADIYAVLLIVQLGFIVVQLGQIANRLAEIVEKMP